MKNLSILSATALIALVSFLTTSTTAYAVEPAVQCEAGKLKEAGKYGFCRLKANSRAVKKATTADYQKCESKFGEKWNKIEMKATAGVCPGGDEDEASLDARIKIDTSEIATLLAGGVVVPLCGNGVIDAGEDCDVGDLGGETCTTQGLFGDALACDPGCVFDSSGCSPARYEDTGFGTVIDHQTGLEWQKTDDVGGLTDKDNAYAWTAGFGEPSGTAFTDFLGGLNGGTTAAGGGPTTGCYAGHCDWRMPLIEELTTIVDCSFGNPCIDQSVFGTTNASPFYWSSSTYVSFLDRAWLVDFFNGATGFNSKLSSTHVRAVRGGS